jgi:hypothetical protein
MVNGASRVAPVSDTNFFRVLQECLQLYFILFSHCLYMCVFNRSYRFYTCVFSLDCNPHPVSLYKGRLPEPRTVTVGQNRVLTSPDSSNIGSRAWLDSRKGVVFREKCGNCKTEDLLVQDLSVHVCRTVCSTCGID